MTLIPVHLHGRVAGFAVVDPSDYEAAARWRWYLHEGYARRVWSTGTRRKGTEVQGRVLLHREVLGLGPGDPDVDHIDRNRLNCRRANLRLSTKAQNGQNRGGLPHTSSIHRGVSWHRARQKWQAYATVAGRRHYLGLFECEEDAARTAAAWRAEHMPYSTDAI